MGTGNIEKMGLDGWELGDIGEDGIGWELGNIGEDGSGCELGNIGKMGLYGNWATLRIMGSIC